MKEQKEQIRATIKRYYFAVSALAGMFAIGGALSKNLPDLGFVFMFWLGASIMAGLCYTVAVDSMFE